ncbi:MAG: ADP-ribosylglycohydrolase family protein [Clostridia bacterium]|nr:ADP-ribosylglycohydrolase family protein [Clostridia bacterium]
MSTNKRTMCCAAPEPEKQHTWEFYSRQLDVELRQSLEEGLDVEKLRPLFDAVFQMEDGNYKEAMADVLYEMVCSAPVRAGYAYNEPSGLAEIRALRKAHPLNGPVPDGAALRDKIAGAWYGRICGCLLGKPVEGCRRYDLIPFLKESGNYPMHRYILQSDVTEETRKKYKYAFWSRAYADTVTCAPVDDDTNYVVLAQRLIRKYGRDFTPDNMMETWIELQSRNAYCTAERVAYRNFIAGFRPPFSAVYKNPYREWIGAQIRGDYFGYINPGNPEMAADMAWRDACISHVKNGIYGEMFAAAMIACAAVTDDLQDIVLGGLAEIPATSRLYAQVTELVTMWASGATQEECFAHINRLYDDRNGHDWCHTISNALIVTACLLYGGGDYGRSICMAVENGFDTDCNGATVGSVLGMRGGMGSIDPAWLAPVRGMLDTSIFGSGRCEVEKLIDRTMEHMA